LYAIVNDHLNLYMLTGLAIYGQKM